MEKFVTIAGGAMVGLVNGFFGGGGGMLCVPLLEKVLKKPTKVSHATAILIILPICIASSITYIAVGNVSWVPTLFVAVGVVAGGILGAILLKKLSADAVGLIFALLMVGVGIKLLLG